MFRKLTTRAGLSVAQIYHSFEGFEKHVIDKWKSGESEAPKGVIDALKHIIEIKEGRA